MGWRHEKKRRGVAPCDLERDIEAAKLEKREREERERRRRCRRRGDGRVMSHRCGSGRSMAGARDLAAEKNKYREKIRM